MFLVTNKSISNLNKTKVYLDISSLFQVRKLQYAYSQLSALSVYYDKAGFIKPPCMQLPPAAPALPNGVINEELV